MNRESDPSVTVDESRSAREDDAAPEGDVVALFVKPGHSVPMEGMPSVDAVENQGLEGDANWGRRLRQVLLIEEETLDDFDLEPGQVRENVVTRGVKLAGLPEGTRLHLGGSILEVTMDCAPCQLIENIRPGLRAAMDGRRGTLCRVVSSGTIRLGDSLTVEDAT